MKIGTIAIKAIHIGEVAAKALAIGANKVWQAIDANEEYSEALDIRPDVPYDETDRNIDMMEEMNEKRV